MNLTSRRTLLTSVAAAAATLPLLNDLAGNGSTAAAATTADNFPSNAALYSSTDYQEGVHWMRRFRTHPRTELFDNVSATSNPVRSTAIIAPHGGGIEAGTSELCLTLAGYSRVGAGTDPVADTAVPQRDYWMFEGLASSSSLHVTSTHCDDPAALAVCGANMYAVSLHGFAPDAGTPAKQILIGGRDTRLMRNLGAAFAKYGLTTGNSNAALDVTVTIAGVNSPLNGDDPANIVNRTRTGAGAQLEISTELRKAMFGDFTSASGRRTSAGVGSANEAHFWNAFVNAVREAVDRHERGLDSL
ncbi:poly-gamma-glutamate hydrolase family protein [Streptomyces vilmorinianum]|uniref:poly-gamma-glutamate hydrolase family protein n=1 Tax=Streptomyces vilmorinianum TaxID=3051092 RepID=UPI0010FB6363|nr:poly-gamma-glutamate hydrolase family protein [Streptomyces vilmorinianum]